MRRTVIGRGGLIATLIVLGACAGKEDPSGDRRASTSPSDSGNQHMVNPLDSGTTGGGADVRPAAADGQVSAADGQISAGDGQTSGGTQSCVELRECLSGCQDDEACANGCFDQGSATAQSQLSAWEACQSDAARGTCKTQCADEQSDECVNCAWPICWRGELTCFSGGKTGTASCRETADCAYRCTEGDSCTGSCLAHGTAAAQQALYAMWICEGRAYDGTCTTKCKDVESEECSTCMNKACSKQYDACK